MRSYRPDHKNPRRLRYGWRLTPSGHIVVDPEQRRCIYFILMLRARQFTLQQICDALTACAIPAPRQGAWYCATVRKILEQNDGLRALLPRVADGVAVRPLESAEACAGPAQRRMHQALDPVPGV
ncbi:MAG: hypothetical protein H6977_08865 [Gammaproteobacteria bacterium]|nr:hypothetical protein [Gammaproteobacteria bacterium]MCP5200113.1 hypothetical protein [Gammaproteobacteria bacterium]